MDLKDTLALLKTLCKSYGDTCEGCPLNYRDFCGVDPCEWDDKCFVEIEAILEERLVNRPTWRQLMQDGQLDDKIPLMLWARMKR